MRVGDYIEPLGCIYALSRLPDFQYSVHDKHNL